jgi:tetratricopeptide (TPR) repeat protein
VSAAFLVTPLSPDRAGGENPAVFVRVQQAVKDAAQAAGVKLEHPLDLHEAGTIMSQVRQRIRKADVVLGIVTGQNPNVFYELGLSRRPAILIGRSADDVPFDIRAERIWTYGGAGEIDTLTERLTAAIRAAAAKRPRSKADQAIRRFSELASHPLPRVRDADLYDMLGVAKSENLDQFLAQGQRPPYVARDADAAIDQALDASPFVILAGPSKAGKSRSAFEALVRRSPDAALLVPFGPTHLDEVIDRYGALKNRPAPAVLWLDDLERFMNSGRVDASLLRDARRRLGLQVVATIRNQELNQMLDAGDSPAGRDAQAVLDSATIVQIADRMSAAESAQASALYPGQEFDPGLGESFIAGRQLKRKLDTGASSLVAIVRAIHDWRRVGMVSGIADADLFALYGAYFRSLEPLRDVTRDAFDQGLAAATAPVVRYSALVLKRSHGAETPTFSLTDYIAEYLEGQQLAILDETWQAALAHASKLGTCYQVGNAALHHRRLEIAADAWRRGMEDQDSTSAFNLGVLLEGQGDLTGAEKAWQIATELGEGAAASNLGSLRRQRGDVNGAAEAYRRALDLSFADAGVHLGLLLHELGDSKGAEEAWERGLALGSPHAAQNLGHLRQLRGDFENARQAWRSGVRLFTDEPTQLKGFSDGMTTQQILQLIVARLRPGGDEGPRVLGDLGARLANIGDLEGAETAWREGIRRQDGMCAVNLGRLLVQRGDRIGAIEAWRAGLQFGSADAAHYLGSALYQDGDQDGARKAWRAALDLKHPAAAHDLGTLLFYQHHEAEAEAAWRDGVALGSAESAEQLVTLLKRQGNVDGMRAMIDTAIGLGSAKAKAWRDGIEADRKGA